MKRLILILTLCIPLFCCGCFTKYDNDADRAFTIGIQDQRMMLIQDKQSELEAVEQAKNRGLQIIHDKRIATGKSLEGLNGPDGKPLLNWNTAELLNRAFVDLETELLQAVIKLKAVIELKYAQREIPIRIAEAYLQYCQVRRATGEYAMAAFLDELSDIRGAKTDVREVISELQSLGLPTSPDEILSWLGDKLTMVSNTLTSRL